MFRFVLVAFTVILPPTVSHAVVDAFGWEYGVPVQESGKLIGPEGIDGPFLNLTRFKMIERRPRDQEGGFRHTSLASIPRTSLSKAPRKVSTSRRAVDTTHCCG